MNIVEFEDGTFGIRKFSLMFLCFVYKDVTSPSSTLWWEIQDPCFKYCKTTKEKAFELFNELNRKRDKYKVDRGRVVKPPVVK